MLILELFFLSFSLARWSGCLNNKSYFTFFSTGGSFLSTGDYWSVGSSSFCSCSFCFCSCSFYWCLFRSNKLPFTSFNSWNQSYNTNTFYSFIYPVFKINLNISLVNGDGYMSLFLFASLNRIGKTSLMYHTITLFSHEDLKYDLLMTSSWACRHEAKFP